MKTSFNKFVAACLALWATVLVLPLMALPPQILLVSPDHPKTWEVDSNPKLEQRMAWSDADRILVATVTYSKLFSPQLDVDPSDYHTFRLRFPQVGLDLKNRLYLLNQKRDAIVIGHLETGVFGEQVVLEKSVELSAHRRQGEMWGMLVAHDFSKLAP